MAYSTLHPRWLCGLALFIVTVYALIVTFSTDAESKPKREWSHVCHGPNVLYLNADGEVTAVAVVGSQGCVDLP